MIVNQTEQRFVRPEDLATALWEATPQEFADFWDALAAKMKADEGFTKDESGRATGSQRLREFALGMTTGCFGRAGPGTQVLESLMGAVYFYRELKEHERRKLPPAHFPSPTSQP